MRYAAFLRAINLASRNRIRMADLRALVEGLGYGDVRTHLQTGNVALDTGRVAPTRIEAAIEQALAGHGLEKVDVMVRTRAQLSSLVRSAPFQQFDPDVHYRFVLFTKTPVEPPAEPLELKGVTFLPSPPHALLAVSEKGSRSLNANSLAEKHWGVRATGRWWNVVEDFTRDVVSA